VNDELVALFGGKTEDISTEGNCTIILTAGLQGSGKTTHTAKLANFIKRKGKSVMMAACDVSSCGYRAIESIGRPNPCACLF
jgi:signal recognition particle subunit SRP54